MMTVDQVSRRLFAQRNEIQKAGFTWKPADWTMHLCPADIRDLKMDPAIMRVAPGLFEGSSLDSFMGCTVLEDPRLEPGDIRIRREIKL